MRSHVRWDCLLKGIEVFEGVSAVLTLIGIGLAFYALHVLEQASLGGFLLFLFIASWIGAIGLACLALIPVVLLVRAKTSCR